MALPSAQALVLGLPAQAAAPTDPQPRPLCRGRAAIRCIGALARLGAAGAYVAERRVRDAYAHLAAALAAAADDGEGLLGERLAAVVDVCYEVRAAAAL